MRIIDKLIVNILSKMWENLKRYFGKTKNTLKVITDQNTAKLCITRCKTMQWICNKVTFHYGTIRLVVFFFFQILPYKLCSLVSVAERSQEYVENLNKLKFDRNADKTVGLCSSKKKSRTDDLGKRQFGINAQRI